jgi:folate-binding protein YgfZ
MTNPSSPTHPSSPGHLDSVAHPGSPSHAGAVTDPGSPAQVSSLTNPRSPAHLGSLSISLSASPTRWGSLPHLGLLRFAGPDAIAFLQGQVSNDTRPLANGKSVLASYSTPQGRVLAVLHLLPHSTGIMAILPSDIVLPTLERLRKYVLRSKVQIQDVSDQFAVHGLLGSAPLAAANLPVPDAPAGYVEHDAIGIAPVGPDMNRYWLIAPRGTLAQRTGAVQATTASATLGTAEAIATIAAATLSGIAKTTAATASTPLPGTPQTTAATAPATLPGTPQTAAGIASTLLPGTPQPTAESASTTAEQFERDWRLANIRSGIPQIYAATREMFVAQMLNLDLVDGISFTKGCFTGQEIVARTQHLGRIKRRLFRLRLPTGTWAIGQAIQLTDGRSGRLTELVHIAGGTELAGKEESDEVLAVLNKDAAGKDAAGQEAADTEPAANTRVDAVELPLPYSLG